MSSQERIRKVLLDLQGTAGSTGPLGELGLVVEDVTVTPVGKRRLVRAWLDRDLSGLDPDDQSSPIDPLSLDEVAEATRVISAAMDASDAMGEEPYVLEVGSPGVDRPLTTPAHFRRNVTRLAEISRHTGEPILGRLVGAGPTHTTVLVAATKQAPGAELVVAYSDILRAQVQVEFARPTTQEDS
ncbi:MAG: ribosome maturation factor RimP [Actinomycetota bacterium]